MICKGPNNPEHSGTNIPSALGNSSHNLHGLEGTTRKGVRATVLALLASSSPSCLINGFEGFSHRRLHMGLSHSQVSVL